MFEAAPATAAEPPPATRALQAWHGGSHILHGVDLDISAGEAAPLLGRDGAGKTTTMKSIIGAIGGRIMREPKQIGFTAPLVEQNFRFGATVADRHDVMERGRIVVSRWTVGQDVPLRVNDELIAWSEFEIAQNRLAVRLTELA